MECGHLVTMHFVNGLVNKASMDTATTNRRTILSCEMDQGKGAVRRIVASTPQLNLAHRLRSAMDNVNLLRGDSKCRECRFQIYGKISGFSTKWKGPSVDNTVKLTSCLLVVKIKGCQNSLCCTELELPFVKVGE